MKNEIKASLTEDIKEELALFFKCPFWVRGICFFTLLESPISILFFMAIGIGFKYIKKFL
jgi:hypothetical protein